jgi:hypothetical protein
MSANLDKVKKSISDYDEVTHAFTKDVSFFHSPELSYEIEPSFPSQPLKNKTVIRDDDHNCMIEYNPLDKKNKGISYKLNNYSHVSEDFVQVDTEKTNVLFAGCSVTAGEYLPYGYSWSHHVYSHLKENNSNIGPQQILGFPGGNASKIIANIFKYVNIFGKPDYIFLLLPDMFRLYTAYESHFAPEITYAEGATINDLMFPFQGMYQYQMDYRNLEIFCSLLGIKLLSTSWEKCANAEMEKLNFKTYSPFKNNKPGSTVNKLSEEKYKGFDKKYYVHGSDKLHPGLISHINYADHFIERLQNDI